MFLTLLLLTFLIALLVSFLVARLSSGPSARSSAGWFPGTLESLAWPLLVFFVFALIAYAVVRGLEMRQQRQTRTGAP